MYETPSTPMRLYNDQSQRLYVNADERDRFLAVLGAETDEIRAFCLTLFYTGCRLSEARELRFSAIQAKSRLISFRSLKKRDQHHIREIPVPQELIDALDALPRDPSRPIWTVNSKKVSRVTANRLVKKVMAKAEIHGAQARPKGLRHRYGIHADRSGIQLNMLKKWMGHSSIATTSIYATAVGREELELADRMW